MAFTKGKSGNPAGRPKGIINQMTLRASIEKDLPDILSAMVEQAKQGDVQAARLLVDKVLPSMKPMDQAIALPVTGADLAKDGRVILSATGAGELTPDTATKLLQGLGSLARIIETDELLKRIERLEAQANGKAGD